jgi:hypothetical protein
VSRAIPPPHVGGRRLVQSHFAPDAGEVPPVSVVADQTTQVQDHPVQSRKVGLFFSIDACCFHGSLLSNFFGFCSCSAFNGLLKRCLERVTPHRADFWDEEERTESLKTAECRVTLFQSAPTGKIRPGTRGVLRRLNRVVLTRGPAGQLRG